MSHNPIYRKLIHSLEWKELRMRKIAGNPLCEDCLLEGRTTLAQEVHHVRPIESGRTETEMKALAFDPHNLRSLCKKCHQKAHERTYYNNREARRKNLDKEKERFKSNWL